MITRINSVQPKVKSNFKLSMLLSDTFNQDVRNYNFVVTAGNFP